MCEAKAQKERHITQRICVIVCNAFCNGFVSYPYYQHLHTIISISYNAFRDCTSLTIYSEATSKPNGWDSDWNYSNCPVYWYSESEPTSSGNYWHYVDGVVTKW